MEQHDAQLNFKKICIIRAIRSGMFSISIIILFFAENGVNLKEAIILQSLFSVASIFLDLPTGNFADRYGRKISIILGGIFSTFGFFLYSLSYGFYGFLLSEMVLALGMSFVSGADSALLLDTQKEALANNQGIVLEGKSRSWGMLSEGLTSLIGGSVLAIISLRLPIYFDAVFSSLVILVALTLVEPKKKTIIKRENVLVSIWKVLKDLNGNGEVKSMIYFSAIASAATLNMVWFIQSYWKLTGLSIVMFGLCWALLQFCGAWMSHYACDIEKFFAKKRSFAIIIVTAVAGYFFLGVTSFVWSSIFLIPFYISRGLNEPIIRNYISLRVQSKDMATIFSAKSSMARIIFAIVGPIMGWVSEITSLQTALIMSGVTFGGMGLVAWMFLLKHKAV
jgi:MFS family permease